MTYRCKASPVTCSQYHTRVDPRGARPDTQTDGYHYSSYLCQGRVSFHHAQAAIDLLNSLRASVAYSIPACMRRLEGFPGVCTLSSGGRYRAAKANIASNRSFVTRCMGSRWLAEPDSSTFLSSTLILTCLIQRVIYQEKGNLTAHSRLAGS